MADTRVWTRTCPAAGKGKDSSRTDTSYGAVKYRANRFTRPPSPDPPKKPGHPPAVGDAGCEGEASASSHTAPTCPQQAGRLRPLGQMSAPGGPPTSS